MSDDIVGGGGPFSNKRKRLGVRFRKSPQPRRRPRPPAMPPTMRAPEPLSEADLRKKYPALQEAYNQYLVLLKLFRAGEGDGKD